MPEVKRGVSKITVHYNLKRTTQKCIAAEPPLTGEEAKGFLQPKPANLNSQIYSMHNLNNKNMHVLKWWHTNTAIGTR